jgi:hypothetical protein
MPNSHARFDSSDPILTEGSSAADGAGAAMPSRRWDPDLCVPLWVCDVCMLPEGLVQLESSHAHPNRRALSCRNARGARRRRGHFGPRLQRTGGSIFAARINQDFAPAGLLTD